ncbi:histidine phosphatase superfamily [Aspergillus karnatakaensis]|uniref:histidine phosphatase family protein n=1 Tax=Aspergillus karnatakaensis TaxID=1810916 RepID=UPI003CCCD28A
MRGSIAATLLGGLTTASAETILGVTIFSRHGDRTSKHHPDYRLTNLGAQQNHQVGSDYRALYLSSNSSKQILGVSEDTYVPGQIFAQSPAQEVLSSSATAFLQGLYPPLSTLDDQILNNGTTLSAPVNGYQYVQLNVESPSSPNSIWTKGDEQCHVVQNIADMLSAQDAIINATRPFYQKFAPVLENVTDITKPYLTYEHAYDIYDLINTALIHNTTLKDAVTPTDLHQLRTLADRRELSLNINPDSPNWSIGGRTLAGAILNAMNTTISSRGSNAKLSFLSGSYNTMIQFFGLYGLLENNNNTVSKTANVDFSGLPNYAATLVVELFTEKNTTVFPADHNDLKVRFLFRNGSEPTDELKAYPLFGPGFSTRSEWNSAVDASNETYRAPVPAHTGVSMLYSDFESEMQQTALTSVDNWCDVCGRTAPFCREYGVSEGPVSTYREEGMSNAVAGVIGAMVALAIMGAVGAAAVLVVRRRWRRRQAVTMEAAMAMGNVKGVEFDVRSVKSGRVGV